LMPLAVAVNVAFGAAAGVAPHAERPLSYCIDQP
jgi:hypothetical protein